MNKNIIVDAIPMDNNYSTSCKNKKIDKNALFFGISISLSLLAIMGYYINIGFMHGIGSAITALACGYSIYNLNKVIKK